MSTEHFQRCFAEQEKRRDREPARQPGPAGGEENSKRRKVEQPQSAQMPFVDESGPKLPIELYIQNRVAEQEERSGHK
jgi:hypothetical protein